MTRRSMKAALLGLTAAALAGAQSASAADAAAPAPVPAAAPGMSGPLIAGVCLISQEDLISRSQVGQAAMGRLHSLTQAAQAALEADKVKIERQSAALNAQRAKLAPAVFQAQGQALNKRAQAFQAEAGERSRQVEATRNKLIGRILEAAQPFFTQAYVAHGCGLLFSRNALIGGNFGNDLTPETLAAMDAKAAPLTFELEPPSAAPAQ